MADETFKKISTVVIFVILGVLAYFLLRPILLSIIIGIILAFMFIPLHKRIYKQLKRKDLSTFITCIILLAIIIIPLWYLTPIILDQSEKLFLHAQQIDFTQVFRNIFPSISQSDTLSREIIPTTGSFVTQATNYLFESLSKFILNIPKTFLHIIILIFTFFFVLRDNKELSSYIRSLIPFSKEVKDKLFKSSKDITLSVVYGRIALGIAQGIIVGIGFFIFGIKNALLLMVLASLAGILPIIGTVIVWLPVSIILFGSGDNVTALGIVGFGLLATLFESVVQPVLLAKMGKMNSSIMLIGMIGGLFLLGILGVLIGPLILAYLFTILDIYRDKKVPGVIIDKKKN